MTTEESRTTSAPKSRTEALVIDTRSNAVKLDFFFSFNIRKIKKN
jgi:hypothetical protein